MSDDILSQENMLTSIRCNLCSGLDNNLHEIHKWDDSPPCTKTSNRFKPPKGMKKRLWEICAITQNGKSKYSK